MMLQGLRVLDLSRLLPGPLATAQLAALGAEVIKVEDPSGGDYARNYPPLFGDPPTSSIFRELNRGKKSIALNLKSPKACAVFRSLALRADVLVDSFRPGVLARLGLDPAVLMQEHPRLIYCAITGFGLFGPDAARAGHDLGFVARSGVLGVSGPSSHPVPAGVQIADVGAAMAAVSGILAALFSRERTGKGQVVDISLLESALPFATIDFGMLFGGKSVRRGQEFLDGSRPAYGVYTTRDAKFISVAALEPKFWQNFLEALGLPELSGAALEVGEVGDAARARLAARIAEKTRDEWAAVFREREACVEPVLELAEVLDDPQLVARGAFLPGGGLASFLRLRNWDNLEEPSPLLTPAPALGADTEAVLRDAGINEAVISQLLAEIPR